MNSSARTRPVDASFVPHPSATVHAVEIDSEAVLLDEAENRLHHLNPTATLVWACLDGHASIAEIATDLSAELGAPYDSVLADTIAAVGMFGDEGLLIGVAPTVPSAPGA